MVPSEFLALDGLEHGAALRPQAVADLFRRCDSLRFSGQGIEQETVFALLDEFKTLAGLLDAAERDGSLLPRSGPQGKNAGGAG
jgi:hypothetical protein